MRLYDRYLVTLAVLFAGTTVLLAVLRQQQVDLYFSLYLIEYLGTTLFFARLNLRALRTLNLVGYIFFAGFLAVIGVRVATIL